LSEPFGYSPCRNAKLISTGYTPLWRLMFQQSHLLSLGRLKK
jgi:hypothetical protein